MIGRALVVVAAVGWASAVSPEDCLLGQAVYGQDESDWTLVFEPVPAENAGGPFSNAFVLDLPGSPHRPSGTVNWTNGFAQPWGEVFLNCEEGSPPEGCRLWEGAVYEVRNGVIDYIATESSPAPEQVLLPDLAGSLWYSNLRLIHLVEDMPWDVFTFKECGP